MKKILSFVKKAFSVFDLQDVFCFGGLAAIGTGLWYYDFRASLVVVGVILMVMGRGILVVRGSKKE